MRELLLRALVAGVAGGAFYWLLDKYIRPRVPRWLHALSFGVMFGLAAACGGWVGAALGWTRPEPRWPLILGGAGAGVVLAVFRWSRDRRDGRSPGEAHGPKEPGTGAGPR